ncbi:MAG: pyridoxal-phosphate dependent enzyme [Candidatus Bipolaricaulota bacterium]|nr:pyridoxal-phosphate dependent enzyme [Candidatus Bipolaricaulota bacterium]
MSEPVRWEDIVAARQRIAPFAHRTPVHTSRLLDAACGARVFLKCENFQRTGSFKFRGATNAVAALTPAEKVRGVIADSSGNHAQALALAACLHQIQATLVMPENANPAKVEATRGYGAQVVFCPPTHEGRHAAVERLVRETGAAYVSPHDDPFVIAGQATAACELMDEVQDLDMILAPVGGGGLLSGTLLAARHMAPKVRVVGCEPSGADDAARSLQSGERVTDFVPHTIADGLRTPLGELAFDILRRGALDDLVLVDEDDILTAMRFVWERTKLVIEPSAAVALAPLLLGKLDVAGQRVGVIVSGGNVDLGPFFATMKGDTP